MDNSMELLVTKEEAFVIRQALDQYKGTHTDIALEMSILIQDGLENMGNEEILDELDFNRE